MMCVCAPVLGFCLFQVLQSGHLEWGAGPMAILLWLMGSLYVCIHSRLGRQDTWCDTAYCCTAEIGAAVITSLTTCCRSLCWYALCIACLLTQCHFLLMAWRVSLCWWHAVSRLLRKRSTCPSREYYSYRVTPR